MRNENKETNQGKKAIGESMGSRIVLALIVVAVIVTAAKVIPLVRLHVQKNAEHCSDPHRNDQKR